jgi:type IV pilus assembly protein PilV
MMNALKQKSQQGVMLLEAMVAILIFSIGIVAVMGMQAASIAQVTQAKFRTDASYLANQIIGKMWVDMPNVPSYTSAGYSGRSAWDTVVANTLPNGAATITVAGTAVPATGGGATVTVTITWKLPEETVSHQYVTSTLIIAG